MKKLKPLKKPTTQQHIGQLQCQMIEVSGLTDALLLIDELPPKNINRWREANATLHDLLHRTLLDAKVTLDALHKAAFNGSTV